MADIVFPRSSSPGFKPSENAGWLINAFSEPLGEGARALYVIRRASGLRELVTTEDYSGCRGMHVVGDIVYMAMEDRLLKLEEGVGEYTLTDLGALTGTGPVTFATNNASPVPNTVVVTENGAFNVFSNSAPTSFADPDLPQPNSVDFKDGYFLFSTADGRAFATGLNDVTVNPLDFARADSNRDALTRIVAWQKFALLFGTRSTEVWENTGNPTGLPFSYVTTITKGLASLACVSGFEDGFAPQLMWVADDNICYRLNGYGPEPISTYDVARDIESVHDKSQLDTFCYVSGGHGFWVVNGPAFSWVYDISTGAWHERKSYKRDNWRAAYSAAAFGGWVIGDRTSGTAFIADDEYYQEGNNPLIMDVLSAPVVKFPARQSVARAVFDFVTGYGMAPGADPIQTEPKCSISWSDDGGVTFGNELLRSMGKQGDYAQKVAINGAGLSSDKGRQWRFQCSDPVYVSIMGGAMAEDVRAA